MVVMASALPRPDEEPAIAKDLSADITPSVTDEKDVDLRHHYNRPGMIHFNQLRTLPF